MIHTSGFDSLLAMNFHGINARRRVSRTTNPSYLIIGALVVIAVFGYQLYRERHNMAGIGGRGRDHPEKVVRYFPDGGLDREGTT